MINLTIQQEKIVKLIKDGYRRNKQLARSLNIHERVVKYHMRNICLKFGVKTRYQLFDKIFN